MSSIKNNTVFGINLNVDEFLDNLTDEQVDKLHSLVWSEKEKRTAKKIKAGAYPDLTDDEKNHAHRNKINAIKAYKNRTNTGLYIAKNVIETYLGEK